MPTKKTPPSLTEEQRAAARAQGVEASKTLDPYHLARALRTLLSKETS